MFSASALPLVWPVQRFLKPGGVGVAPQEHRNGRSDGNGKRASQLHQSGWITLEGGFAARQCVVQDLSSAGAKITVDDADALPAKLRLAFSRDARNGRACQVMWRRGKSVGVKFVR